MIGSAPLGNICLPINLRHELSRFESIYLPKISGEYELIYQFKIPNLGGTFVPHFRWDTDETFFLVIKGEVLINFQDDRLTLSASETSALPKAVPHGLPCGTFVNNYAD